MRVWIVMSQKTFVTCHHFDARLSFCSYGLETQFDNITNVMKIYPFCSISTFQYCLLVFIPCQFLSPQSCIECKQRFTWPLGRCYNLRRLLLLALSIGVPLHCCIDYISVDVTDSVDNRIAQITVINNQCNLVGTSPDLLQYSSFIYVIFWRFS